MKNTMKFSVEDYLEQGNQKDILLYVFKALEEKGYNPVNQLVGYLLSGDPTYITTYNDARTMIKKVERDEILEELLTHYMECVKK
ncbi:IreB family regulatory phosphoprotein [Fusibacter ferrireducens]|uniref:IreB family regulatory phosphoprotein n=1 Tax=Fusibacter ferrireducens TaxID=2785058 RepID=A0ABR9ZTC1_9FIRM|nr:IreB family regulatory phosphoprotein [Fusibacter ferrireducens]MBF4693702.1 IreB family regulatory phosphoprotein [Fusibacter ferrireducens]